jgi:hypothetical protein
MLDPLQGVLLGMVLNQHRVAEGRSFQKGQGLALCQSMISFTLATSPPESGKPLDGPTAEARDRHGA